MFSQQHVQQFTRQLRHNVPGIENLQLLTVDGLAMHSDQLAHDEDKLSALSALIYSAAQRLADCMQEDAPKGLIVCIGTSAYVIARVGDELMLGLQVPADLGHPQFLQTVCNFIGQHEHGLSTIH
jgi:predicted regulator of Ras-like GTPase activity (Roadblock/LC7/MglB family)